MEDVSERELAAALQRAILRATEEVLPRGDAISADTYADCLVGQHRLTKQDDQHRQHCPRRVERAQETAPVGRESIAAAEICAIACRPLCREDRCRSAPTIRPRDLRSTAPTRLRSITR
jgi:hypothetical protein